MKLTRSSSVSAVWSAPFLSEVNGGLMFQPSRSIVPLSKIAQLGPAKKSGDFEPSLMATAASVPENRLNICWTQDGWLLRQSYCTSCIDGVGEPADLPP